MLLFNFGLLQDFGGSQTYLELLGYLGDFRKESMRKCLAYQGHVILFLYVNSFVRRGDLYTIVPLKLFAYALSFQDLVVMTDQKKKKKFFNAMTMLCELYTAGIDDNSVCGFAFEFSLDGWAISVVQHHLKIKDVAY